MAKVAACFIFIVWTLSPILGVTGQTIRIGAIFSPDTRKGKEEATAIQLAVQQFSSSPAIILNGKHLNSTNPLLSSNYAQEFVTWAADLIIVTGTTPQALYAGDVAKEARIPIFSLVPSSLLSKPFLAQMSYPDAAFIKCIVAVVKSLKWRRIIAVYEDDEYGTVSNSALMFSHGLREVGSELEYSAVFEPLKTGSDPKSFVQAELREMKTKLSTVYVILHSSEALALSLFEEATNLEMMGSVYVWMCGNDITSLLDSTFNRSFISKYMQGVLGVESYINISNTEYRNFYYNFQQAFKGEFEKKGETAFTPGVFAFRAYDMVEAIAHASIESQMNGKALVDNSTTAKVNGFSGGNSSAFRLIKVFGTSYKLLGYWLDNYGFYDNDIDLSLRSQSKNVSAVIWPGDQKDIPNGLRKLRVGIPANPVWEKFVKVDVDIKSRTVSNATGFCIKVFEEVLEKMDNKIEYEYVPFLMGTNSSYTYEYIQTGYINTVDFTYDNLVDQVRLKKVDMVVGDVTIMSSRLENVSFTQPFLSSGLVMLVPLEHDNAAWLLWRPFKTTLWLGIFGLMLFIFLSVWLLEKYDGKADDDFRGPWYKQIGATFWIMGNSLFQAYGHKIGNYYTKAVIVCWMLVVLIVSATYTANLSSILTVDNLKPRFDDAKIACDGDSFVKTYLKDVLHYNQDIIEVTNTSDYPGKFVDRTISAAYLEVPYLRVFLPKYKGYTVYGEIHTLGGFGFVLPKFSTMTFDMSKAILELTENGTLKKLEDQWFQISFNTTMPTKDDTKNQRLDIESFSSLLIFCFCVALCSVSIFLIHKRRSFLKNNAQVFGTKDEEMVSVSGTKDEEMVSVSETKDEEMVPVSEDRHLDDVEAQ